MMGRAANEISKRRRAMDDQACLADLTRFAAFGPEFDADWLQFLRRQSYHIEWLRRSGQR